MRVIIGKRRIENVRVDFLLVQRQTGSPTQTAHPPSTTNTRRPVIERQGVLVQSDVTGWVRVAEAFRGQQHFTPTAIRLDCNTCKKASEQTYVDNDSFAKVMVVWNGLEGSNPRVLTEGVESAIIVLTGQFGQRPVHKKKIKRKLVNRTSSNHLRCGSSEKYQAAGKWGQFHDNGSCLYTNIRTRRSRPCGFCRAIDRCSTFPYGRGWHRSIFNSSAAPR